MKKIIVKGARTHNLKNITVEMPRNKMVVFTGLSGSGKSSLAFDTILPRDNADMWNLFLLTLVNLSARCRNRMWTRYPDSRRQFPLTKNQGPTIPVQPWRPSRKYTIIFGCFMLVLADRIVSSATGKSKNYPTKKFWKQSLKPYRQLIYQRKIKK